MKNSIALKSYPIFLCLSFVIIVSFSITPVQAQVKRDHRTKKVTTRDHRTKSPQKNPVAVDDSKNNFLVTNPPRSTRADIEKWNKIVYKMQGIEGFDPVRNNIGTRPAEKKIKDIPGTGYKNNWLPLSTIKQVCCGKLENFKTYDGTGDEMDWNLFILPNDDFSFLITETLPYKEETLLMSSSGWHKNKRGQYLLEGEVTPDQSLYQNVFFPFKKKKGKKSQDPVIGLEGKEICLYGPWVREWLHHHRPEIHPSEMIWWKEAKGYYMMLIQDDSNRFDSKGDFDLDGIGDNNWKPWAAPPLTAQFKIAFEIKPSIANLPYKMDIREVYKRFVVTKEDATALADADNGTSHALVVNNKKLLVVNEQQENDKDLGVKFVDITKRADGTIQGYVQITTKVGGPDLGGDEGYHILYVASGIPNKISERANKID